MSYQVIDRIRETCVVEGGKRLTLQAMAHHAGKDGRDIWPGLDLLAAHTCQTQRGTRDAIQKLRAKGLVILLDDDGSDLPATTPFSGGRGRVARFRIDLDRLEHLQRVHITQKPSCLWCAARRKRQKRIGGKAENGNGTAENRTGKAEDVSTKAENGSALYIEELSLTVIEPIKEKSGISETANAVEGEILSEIDLAVLAYNRIQTRCPSWSPALIISEQRQKDIADRLCEVGLAGWSETVRLAAQSDFLTNRPVTDDDQFVWQVNIGWIARQENFIRIREGLFAPAGRSVSPRHV